MVLPRAKSGEMGDFIQTSAQLLDNHRRMWYIYTEKVFCLPVAERRNNQQAERHESANEKRFSKENI